MDTRDDNSDKTLDERKHLDNKTSGLLLKHTGDVIRNPEQIYQCHIYEH